MNLVWPFTAIAFLLLVWLAAYKLAANDYLVPSLGDTLREAGGLLKESGFWRAFLATFLRSLEAFALSFLAAFVLSVIAYLLPAFGKFLAPIVSVLRSLPTMAILLLLLVWTTPKRAPVIVAFLALFPILYAGMSAALAAVPSELIQMSRIYRVPLAKRIFGLYLPAAAPYVLKESAAALSFSLKLTVSAEVLANTAKSLGGMLQEARIFLEMPRMFAITVLAVAVGFLMELAGMFVARAAERRYGCN